MTEIEKLSEKLSLLARPGVHIDSVEEQVSIRFFSRRNPETQILGYAFVPKGEAWQDEMLNTIQGFSEFLEFTSNLIGKTPERDVFPMGMNGDVFNYGFMMNSHGLSGLFRLKTTHLEEDKENW